LAQCDKFTSQRSKKVPARTHLINHPVRVFTAFENEKNTPSTMIK